MGKALKKRNGRTPSERVGKYDPLLARAKYRMSMEAMQDKYNIDKLIGLRLPTGTSRFKQLSIRHKKIIALFAQGMKVVDIAEIYDCDMQLVYKVLHDPLTQQWLAQWSEMVDKELEQLMYKSVNAIRDALDNENINVRLRGVDRMARMTGRFDPKDRDAADTAEDVISRALAIAEKGMDAIIQTRPDRARLIDLKPEGN